MYGQAPNRGNMVRGWKLGVVLYALAYTSEQADCEAYVQDCLEEQPRGGDATGAGLGLGYTY